MFVNIIVFVCFVCGFQSNGCECLCVPFLSVKLNGSSVVTYLNDLFILNHCETRKVLKTPEETRDILNKRLLVFCVL